MGDALAPIRFSGSSEQEFLLIGEKMTAYRKICACVLAAVAVGPAYSQNVTLLRTSDHTFICNSQDGLHKALIVADDLAKGGITGGNIFNEKIAPLGCGLFAGYWQPVIALEVIGNDVRGMMFKGDQNFDAWMDFSRLIYQDSYPTRIEVGAFDSMAGGD